MADRNKFEEMLERLINEDRAGAEELFHEIVVEKSRDIYESLLESDLEEIEEKDEEVDEAAKDDEDEDEKVKEAADEDDEEVDENFDLDEFEVEGEPAMGGDPTDDMMGDVEMDADDSEMDMDAEGGDGLEDRVVDLEDALDELKAEFEKMMADEGDDEGEEESDDEADTGDEEGEEGDKKETLNFGEADEEVEESKHPKSDVDVMKEYVQKVTAKMGDNGANTKSVVAGKNDMGGTTANIVKGSAEEKGGKAPSSKEDDMGNVNVPGGNASKSMKAMPKGHGAEKKGAGEQAANKKSIVGSK